MVCERLAMAAALTRTVEYPQFARTEAMIAMESEMMQRAIADPGNIIRSIADAATSQSENDDHISGEGIVMALGHNTSHSLSQHIISFLSFPLDYITNLWMASHRHVFTLFPSYPSIPSIRVSLL